MHVFALSATFLSNAMILSIDYAYFSVLTLTAPKFPEEKKSIRSISITSGGSGTQKQVGSGHDEAA
jgi:hypothetical protein